MKNPNLKDIKSVLMRLSNDVSSLDMLMEFERTLDNVHLYAYDNWFNGELVSGPEISRYWVSCTFMFPDSMKPDPDGALRLEKYGCKVTFKQDVFNTPVRITSRNSYENPYTKQAKMKQHKVWLVTIEMPRRFIDDSIDDMLEYMNTGNAVDTSDISAEYDNNVINTDDLNLDAGMKGQDQ